MGVQIPAISETFRFTRTVIIIQSKLSVPQAFFSERVHGLHTVDESGMVDHPQMVNL